MLKSELFHYLLFKLFDPNYRRSNLENTFWSLLSERFVAENVLVLKVRYNVSYHISPDKRRALNKKHLQASKLSDQRGSLL